MPEEKVVSETDAKESTDAKAESSPEKTEAKEVLTEEDLNLLDGDNKIPYSRFKEVNEKAKNFELQLEDYKEDSREQLNNITAQYEARIAALSAAPKETEPYEDYLNQDDSPSNTEVSALINEIKSLKEEVTSIKSSNSRAKTESQISNLKEKYPKADVNAVLGWAKVMPNSSIGELMEKSHVDTTNNVKAAIREILDAKSAKARRAVPLGEGGGIKLKDEEKPKTVKGANKAFRDFINKGY